MIAYSSSRSITMTCGMRDAGCGMRDAGCLWRRLSNGTPAVAERIRQPAQTTSAGGKRKRWATALDQRPEMNALVRPRTDRRSAPGETRRTRFVLEAGLNCVGRASPESHCRLESNHARMAPIHRGVSGSDRFDGAPWLTTHYKNYAPRLAWLWRAARSRNQSSRPGLARRVRSTTPWSAVRQAFPVNS